MRGVLLLMLKTLLRWVRVSRLLLSSWLKTLVLTVLVDDDDLRGLQPTLQAGALVLKVVVRCNVVIVLDLEVPECVDKLVVQGDVIVVCVNAFIMVLGQAIIETDKVVVAFE